MGGRGEEINNETNVIFKMSSKKKKRNENKIRPVIMHALHEYFLSPIK